MYAIQIRKYVGIYIVLSGRGETYRERGRMGTQENE